MTVYEGNIFGYLWHPVLGFSNCRGLIRFSLSARCQGVKDGEKKVFLDF